MSAVDRSVVRAALAAAPLVTLGDCARLAWRGAWASPADLSLVELVVGQPGAPHLLAPLAAWPPVASLLHQRCDLHSLAGGLAFYAIALAIVALLYGVALLGLLPLARWTARVAALRAERLGVAALVLFLAPLLLPALPAARHGDGATRAALASGLAIVAG
ncbi:MAG: hypothetical protein SF182_18045, partial [Deltaproteobacteria bacterium]|nr:hypothetical protein [Deltaproteobacteria bacterium]